MITAPSDPTLPAPGALAGLDPGRGKCGLVRTDAQRRLLLEACILPPKACLERILQWRRAGLISGVVLGNGTSSEFWQSQLADLLPLHSIDERNTTLEARRRFWQLEPARGWRRLLPEGLRQPPRDWDDIVAQLLLERWLGHSLRKPPAQ
ncbi:MAG: resolvase [Cyanobacteriota bacterium]|nr:resolvase [Cyanobacteriota bacterium]